MKDKHIHKFEDTNESNEGCPTECSIVIHKTHGGANYLPNKSANPQKLNKQSRGNPHQHLKKDGNVHETSFNRNYKEGRLSAKNEIKPENGRQGYSRKFIIIIIIISLVVISAVLLSIGVSFIMLRSELRRHMAHIDDNVLCMKKNLSILEDSRHNEEIRIAHIDENVFVMKKNLSTLEDSSRDEDIRIDKRFERLDEKLGNLQSDVNKRKEELKFAMTLKLKSFSFEPTTLYRYVYVSNNNRTLSSYRTPNGLRGTGNGFQKYYGVRGNVPFTNFDIIYFEVLVHYTIIGNATKRNLIFEVGFSTEDTIDDHWYVGGQNKSWSLYCAVNNNEISIDLRYRVNAGKYNFLKTVSNNLVGESYQGIYGFFIHGPKREIKVIEKIQNTAIMLHKFENVSFSEHLYPVFGIYNTDRFNTSLTLITGKDIEELPDILFN